jgi:nucleoside phosphorylase
MGNAIMNVNAIILFGMALGLQASWQVNDISLAAKLDRLDACMTYLQNELCINPVDAGNGSIGLGCANR